MTNDCPFCGIEKEKILISSDKALAFFDSAPVSPGHVLIVPRRHVPNYFDLTEEEAFSMHSVLLQVKELLDKRFSPAGYNIGINVGETAGQSISHVHIHLIPRYRGDVENPRGGVRGVIPGKQSY